MRATQQDIKNLQANMINMGNNLQTNQMGLQEQILSLNNRLNNLELKLHPKFTLIENSEFFINEYNLYSLTSDKYLNVKNMSIKIDKIINQINDESIQIFKGMLYGAWNNYKGELINGVYNIELNIGKIIELGKYDTDKDSDTEVGYIDFKLNSDSSMHIISYNINSRHNYLYSAKLLRRK